MIDFNELVENYLRRESKARSVGRYYPSEAGSCLRKSWYSYNIPREVDMDLIKVFEAGNLVHDFIVNVLMSEKNPHIELLNKEIPFEMKVGDIVISGRIDDIILVKIDGIVYIVEVKSTSSIRMTEKPNDGHVYQIQLYMHHAGIHNGVILYVEKNTLQSKAFEVRYDMEMAGVAIERIKAVHAFLMENKLPKPEARMRESMRWQCKKCQYFDECYEATPASEEAP